MAKLRNVDPHIWKACAGKSVQIPTVNSRVYYFPEGHAEQSSSPPNFSSIIFTKPPLILCRTISVQHLVNPETEEVFAKICLEPVDSSLSSIVCEFPAPDGKDVGGGEEEIESFAKVLTPSDANNGGGFSVPRYCADTIFPTLNYKDERPAQRILVRDVQGAVWDFRHIYRGSPRRHLLTTGWSKYVNQKKLVAGDSVVFMKNRSGNLFVGIRRAWISSRIGDCGWWHCQNGAGSKLEEEFGNKDGFSRSKNGRISAESVVQSAELAAMGRPFEIVYYPNIGSSDFVVKAETVDDSLNILWRAGMRLKMAVETEDSSRMTWFHGTVSSASFPDHSLLYRSPWRMLEVTWDEPEVLRSRKRVSPWQVELVEATPPLQTPFPPTKRLRVPHNPDLLTNGEEAPFFPIAGLTNAMMGQLSSSLFHSNSFPAGMQGARHDPTSLSNLLSNNNSQILYSDHIVDKTPQLGPVSEELNIGSTSQFDNSSPQIQGNVHFFGTKPFGYRTENSTTKAGTGSFQLFGTTIQTDQPVDDRLDDGGCT